MTSAGEEVEDEEGRAACPEAEAKDHLKHGCPLGYGIPRCQDTPCGKFLACV